MQDRIDAFMSLAAKRNANEPEFLQAVQEVAETVIPFVDKPEVRRRSNSRKND